MAKYLHYNFSAWLEVIDDMITEYNRHCKISNKTLIALKREVNRFFTNSECIGLLFTENDSLFFGMCVHPELTPQFIRNVIENQDENLHIDKYRIEIDSKIFSSILDITKEEILAMMLHEIGHIVNDNTICEEMKDAVNVYAAKNHISVRLPDSGTKELSLAIEILRYGFNASIRKMKSMFCIYKNGEVLADHFVYEYGYLDALQSIFKKVTKNGLNVNNTVSNKLVALTWSMRLMTDIAFKRNTAVHTLMDAYRITQSKLEKISIKAAMDKLKAYSTQDDVNIVNIYEYYDLNVDIDPIDEQEIIEESKEAEKKKEKRKRDAILKGIEPFEEDYYEFVMEARSLVNKNDALYVLRQVNHHISVLEDVIQSVELKQAERTKYLKLLEQYRELRFDLAHNSKFKYDYTGSVITISYPEL